MNDYQQQKKVLADYFNDYMKLYHRLQLSECDTEIAEIELEVNRIREEVKERYPFYDKT